MKHDLTEQIREAGYEALFLLGGFLGGPGHPPQRNLERALAWVDESVSRRQQLTRLAKRGLIETEAGGGGAPWVWRLTEQGRAVFSGGRDPEAAWNRDWDGRWRLLSFDLPRTAHGERMRLRRWMKANYVGQVQGSVWITPDPVSGLEEILGGLAIDPTGFLVFEGSVLGSLDPVVVADKAWDFPAINAGYAHYIEVATTALHTAGGKPLAMSQLRNILSVDRKAWWEAVRRDPLLPRALHPGGYRGGEAWKVRGKLMAKLGKRIPTGAGDS